VRRAAGIALVALLMSGCAQPSAPITIAQALRELQRQLIEAGAVSAVGSDPARFAATVRAAQCAASQADPEVPLLAHELSIGLSGSFTATGGFSVGPSPLVTSLTGSGSRTQGQQITLPLSFVAVSEIPAVSTAQRLAALSGLPDADRKAQTASILADREALRARIGVLIAGWSRAACRDGQPAGLFHPDARS
jgi:hypothetical protein